MDDLLEVITRINVKSLLLKERVRLLLEKNQQQSLTIEKLKEKEQQQNNIILDLQEKQRELENQLTIERNKRKEQNFNNHSDKTEYIEIINKTIEIIDKSIATIVPKD